MAETSTRQDSNENLMALVAYILTWITGLIVLLTAPKGAKYQRWHAIQAIGLGIALTLFYLVWTMIVMGMIVAGSGAAGVLGLVSTLVWLAVIALIIILAVRAYQGKKIRLPIIAGIADKNA